MLIISFILYSVKPNDKRVTNCNGKSYRSVLAYKHNGRCGLHRELSTEARTPEGLQQISEVNLKHGMMTKEKLATQRLLASVSRSLRAEIKRFETADCPNIFLTCQIAQ